MQQEIINNLLLSLNFNNNTGRGVPDHSGKVPVTRQSINKRTEPHSLHNS